MTTEESPTHIDTSSADYTGTVKKPSLLGKVKAKARRLRDKLTAHNGGENPTHDNVHGSASSDEEEEEGDIQELSDTPLSSAVNLDDDKITAHSIPPGDFDSSGKQSDHSRDGNLGAVLQEDRKFGELDSPDHQGRWATEDSSPPVTGSSSSNTPVSQFISAGPAGVEQAVPTSYNYYNKDPAVACITSSPPALGTGNSDSHARREETPSVPRGGQSAGITPMLSDSRASGSAVNEAEGKSFSSGEFSLRDNSNKSAERSVGEDRNAESLVGIVASGAAEADFRQGRDHDSFSRRSYNEDVGSTISTTTVNSGEAETESRQGRDNDSFSGKSYDKDVGNTIPTTAVTSGEAETEYRQERDRDSFSGRSYNNDVGSTIPTTAVTSGEAETESRQGGDHDSFSGRSYNKDVGSRIPTTVVTSGEAEPESRQARDHDSFSGRSYNKDVGSIIPTTAVTPGEAEPESRQGRDHDCFSGRSYNKDAGSTIPSTTVSGTVAAAENSALDEVGYGATDEQKPTYESSSTDYKAESQKPLHQQADEGLTTAAVGMGQNSGDHRDYDDAPTDSSEPNIAQRGYDTIVGTKDVAADTLSGGDRSDNQPGQPTMPQKDYSTILGTKDAAADKLGYNNQSFPQPATDEPTLTQKASDTMVGTKDALAARLPSVTQQAEPTTAQQEDSAVDKLSAQSGITDDNANIPSRPHTNSFFDSTVAPFSESDSSTEARPSWNDSTGSTLGLGDTVTGKPQIDRDLSTSTSFSTDQKPLTEKLTETGVDLKETVARKLGYGGSSTHTSGEQKIQSTNDRAIDAKDINEETFGQGDAALSSDSTPVSQKLADTVYGEKESLVSKVTPSEDDEATAQAVTKTITDLPILLTENLRFGDKSDTATKTPTTTRKFKGPSELDGMASDNQSHDHLSTAPDKPDSTPSQGIMDRVTDAVSSLFGGSKKSTAGGGEYSPASSPSDYKDSTGTSSMGSDLSGVNTPTSSPAA